MATDQGKASVRPNRVEYEKPPIVEALCQFNFASPLAWSPVIPGLFFQKIRAEYPTEPAVQQQVQANVEFPNDAAGRAQFTMGQGDQRLIYKNASENRLVVLTPTTISANSLPPYEGWPGLSSRFQRALTKTKSILGDPRVAAVSVRYINRIFVPDGRPFDVSSMFNIPFRVVGDTGATLKAHFQKSESILADGVTRGLSTFASVEPIDGETDGEAYLLDLEFRRGLSDPISFVEAMAVADELKVRENAEFESCITDRTRELFR